MNIKVTKRFIKQTKALPASVQMEVGEAIKKMMAADHVFDLTNIKKLKGGNFYYRLRLGDYRIGFELRDGNNVVLIIIAHRRDIYKTFP